MSLIKDTSIKIFLDAVKRHGENTVTKLLKNLKTNSDVLKNLIIELTEKEFNISKKEAFNIKYNYVDFKSIICFLLKKYLYLKNKDISIELNISQQLVYKYIKRIKNLDTRIKQDAKLINIIEKIENNILQTLNK